MTFRIALGLIGAVYLGAGVWAQQQQLMSPPSASAPAAMTDQAQNALIDEYCTPCHNPGVKSGDLVLERFNVASPLLSSDLLERMIRKLRAGQMPPADAERPEPDELASLVRALEDRADAKAARVNDPGWRPFQRLNRAEYAHVVKDVFAVEIDPSAILPPDTVSGGFDNIADVQTVSPALISAYLRGATTVSGAALATTEGRHKVLTCAPRTTRDEQPCAETILRRLLNQALRGAATDLDVTDALTFYTQGRTRGSFEDGIRLAVQSILVHPKFLFRMEPTGESGALTDVALASRLSFFLWGTGPDETLITAALKGALHTPEQLATQATRMLTDVRAGSLSTRFAAQWLRLQDLDKVELDPALRRDMRQETELMVADVVRRDANVMDLITSDRSFVNARLATHYGIPNVRGGEFRSLQLPQGRRGLLGQASILTLTSLGTRTSPVLRGKWVLDVLLGTPPPPPPPNVPSLDDSAKPGTNGVVTTRQRVEQHRRNPSCSACHRVIDPPGMTLEHFDPTGAWRAQDNGADVDATATLYDGRRMEGADGLRAALVARQDMVLRNFTQQLMTYALGRRLSYRDMPAVRRIVRTADGSGNRFSAFVVGVVTSDAFRMARPPKEF